jgi:hypothetical protein
MRLTHIYLMEYFSRDIRNRLWFEQFLPISTNPLIPHTL